MAAQPGYGMKAGYAGGGAPVAVATPVYAHAAPM